MNVKLLKKPSALLPFVLSFAALALSLVHTAMYGSGDEVADVFSNQLFKFLLIAQIPVIVFFAIKWLPQAPGDTLRVLAMQFGAALVTIVLVFWIS